MSYQNATSTETKSMQNKSEGRGSLVRRLPTVKTLTHRQIHSTFYVKRRTPYVSAIKRIARLVSQLSRHGAKYVTVLGMGAAAEKTLAIGCHFQDSRGCRIEVLTKTVNVLDERTVPEGPGAPTTPFSTGTISDAESNSDDEITELTERTLSGVEVRIYGQ